MVVGWEPALRRGGGGVPAAARRRPPLRHRHGGGRLAVGHGAHGRGLLHGRRLGRQLRGGRGSVSGRLVAARAAGRTPVAAARVSGGGSGVGRPVPGRDRDRRLVARVGRAQAVAARAGRRRQRLQAGARRRRRRRQQRRRQHRHGGGARRRRLALLGLQRRDLRQDVRLPVRVVRRPHVRPRPVGRLDALAARGGAAGAVEARHLHVLRAVVVRDLGARGDAPARHQAVVVLPPRVGVAAVVEELAVVGAVLPRDVVAHARHVVLDPRHDRQVAVGQLKAKVVHARLNALRQRLHLLRRPRLALVPALRGLDEDRFARLQVPARKHAVARGPGGLQRGNCKHSCADGTVVSVSGRSRGCEWPRYSQRRRVLEDAAVGGNQVELGARHGAVSTKIVE
eukprot:Partr_v1_DN1854_c0_g2_i1_m45648